MTTGKRGRGSHRTDTDERPSALVYVHGIGVQPPLDDLKLEWDLALFGRDMRTTSAMAYWADVPRGGRRRRTRSIDADGIDVAAMLEDAGVRADNRKARALARALVEGMGVEGADRRTKVLPLPAFMRKPIARAFLEALVRDTAAYFFRPEVRRSIQDRLRDALPGGDEPVTIVAHSQGSIVALEVLAGLSAAGSARPYRLVSIGSPLGVREVQDLLSDDCYAPGSPRRAILRVPACVQAWHNFADPLDRVALDKGIANDFEPGDFIVDKLVVNLQSRRLDGFNPHSAAGYLAHPDVREVVHDAVRVDGLARFLVARDVAADLAVDARQPVLIEILEPGYQAVDEAEEDMRKREAAEVGKRSGNVSIAGRVESAAREIEAIVGRSGKKHLDAARVDRLRRFVAARLTPAELNAVARRHKDLRIYAVWKSTRKRKLLHRSGRVIQADAARASYGALGDDIRWAVLDTGVRVDHPHFVTHGTIIAAWDCTKPGPPRPIDSQDRDRDGHGTHVAGIIAGASADAKHQGIAPRAKLVVYKVLNDRGEGEDAWIIKALDHIAEQNENNAHVSIDGVNLSLGGPYDATVYGCGFTPICMELRRLWRSGVLVCVASGNEGQVQVTTPDGELDLNSLMSIGDPANLEDCIAVGSVNADRPHLYGISSFSSRGPTSDGRMKPDVVAPGERIRSCNSRYRSPTAGRAPGDGELYRAESGTSMAAPHVSGLLAAFLSVRREFRGRPDEVKALLLRTCIDIGRDRYHQGRGIPNLMRMLLEA